MADSKTIDDGGSAFPFEGGENNGLSPEWGMSLRDWFAGQALAGFVRHSATFFDAETGAKLSYRYADAMIAARKAGG